jgi:hypothetical protein
MSCHWIMLNTSFSNKTQLKNKKYFLFYWVRPGSMHFELWTGSDPVGTGSTGTV